MSNRNRKREKIRFNKDLLDLTFIKRILAVVWSCSKKLTIYRFTLLVLQAIIPFIPLYLMKLLLDAFAAGSPVKSYIFWILAGFAIVKIVSIILSNITSYVSMLHSDVIADHMSHIVISKAIDIDMEYFDSDRYHDIFARAIGQSSGLPLQVLGTVMGLFSNLITLIAVAGVLFTLHWGIALILFFVAIPAALIRWHYTEKTVELREQQTQRERRSGYLRSVLTGRSYAKEVRIFDFGDFLLRQFLNLRAILRKEKRDLYLKQNVSVGMAQSVEAVAVIGALGYIATWAIRGLITVGDIAMYYGVFQKGQSGINGVLKSFVSLHSNRLFLGHLFEFLDLEPKITDRAATVDLSEKIKTISIENLDFIYPGTQRTVLKDINLEIHAGEIIAIVGENGSGKTTLIKLINRLYEPTRGSIKINGKELKQFSLHSFRKKLTVIFQIFSKYNASVKENIQYSDIHHQGGKSKVIQAAQFAHSDDFISTLPNQYDTQLGRSFRQGEELSGGQWQKLALTRAFYKDADIIVLDEPTSFIDPLAEEDIFSNLRKLNQDNIMILITHRIYNLKMADRIFVMDAGKIIESGSHIELVERDGLYKEMFDKQS